MFTKSYCYYLCMQVGNVFSHVCVSVCLSIQAITFELLHIETSSLVCRYILTITRSSLSTKVIGSSSRSYEKNIYLLPNSMSNFTYFNTFILCVWLQAINKVKFIHQSEGHIKVKVKYLHPFRFYVASTLFKRVVWI